MERRRIVLGTEPENAAVLVYRHDGPAVALPQSAMRAQRPERQRRRGLDDYLRPAGRHSRWTPVVEAQHGVSPTAEEAVQPGPGPAVPVPRAAMQHERHRRRIGIDRELRQGRIAVEHEPTLARKLTGRDGSAGRADAASIPADSSRNVPASRSSRYQRRSVNGPRASTTAKLRARSAP